MPRHRNDNASIEGRSLFSELEEVQDRAIARGRRIAAARRAHGWVQEDLAQRTGLRVSTISRIERGVILKPQPRTLATLAKTLGLSSLT